MQVIAWRTVRNNLECVEWDVKPYSLTRSLTKSVSTILYHWRIAEGWDCAWF